jgi:spermidine synthase
MQLKKIFRYLSSFVWGYSLEKTSSPVNPYLEVCYINGKMLLNSENVNYAYGSCSDAFNTIFRKLNIKDREPKSVLILGYGVGCIADLLRNKYDIDAAITGVEKDAKVLELGNKYFEASKLRNVKVVCDDAIDFMQKNKELFDMIVVDIFIDHIVPEMCQQEAFLNDLQRSLSDSGLLVFNKLEIKIQSASTLESLKTCFNKVMPGYLIHQLYKDEPNYMFVFTKSASLREVNLELGVN